MKVLKFFNEDVGSVKYWTEMTYSLGGGTRCSSPAGGLLLGVTAILSQEE